MADDAKTETTPAADPPADKVAELSRESASYRTQRNEALRRSHAYETMLKAHGIDLAPASSETVQNLPIKAGSIDGKWDYTPPKIEVPKQAKPPEAAATPTALTKEALHTMSHEEINKRWDEVSALMQGWNNGQHCKLHSEHLVGQVPEPAGRRAGVGFPRQRQLRGGHRSGG